MPTDTPDPNIIRLSNVRLSYPQLFTASVVKNSRGEPQGKPKFSATFLMDVVNHAKLINLIEKTIERVALDEFKKKVILKHSCLHDGNEKDETDGYGDGVMFLKASNKTRPPVVNRDKSPIVEQDGLIYGGCYVNATVRIYAMEHEVGGKQVNAQLRAVQFLKDGESFGADPVNVEDEFESLEEKMEDL